ncbi:MAG: mechanosensitive ion channel family protein [Theionarchaea archaeon]|nr:mechanosensitive ion channel family protein [Theionarchaea archaeon]
MFNVSLPDILKTAAVFLGGVFMLKVSSIIFTFIKRTYKIATLWDTAKIEVAQRAVQFIIVAVIFYYIIGKAEHDIVTTGLEIALIFLGGYLSAKGVTSLLDLFHETLVKESQIKHDLVLPLVAKLLSIFIYVVALLISLHYLGYNVTALLAGMGIAGIALSLAAKDSISNIISGILLVLDKPFVPGDRIEIWNPPPRQGTWGDVVSVGLRSTKIKTTDNITIIVPNSQLMTRDIINYTEGSPRIRLRIPVDVSYRSDLETVEKVLLDLVKGTEGLSETPEPRVVMMGFSDSSIHLELRIWIDDAKKRRRIQDTINRRIKSEFEKLSIEIPYPKRDVYIKESP